MASQPCIVCGHTSARLLPVASKDAFVNYYRCDLCRHVWTVHKTDPSRIEHVTRFRKPKL
jgi:hypothetical protein